MKPLYILAAILIFGILEKYSLHLPESTFV